MTQDPPLPADTPPTTQPIPSPVEVDAASPRPQSFNRIAATAIFLLALIFTAYGIHDRYSITAAGQEASRQIAEQTALATEGTLDSARQMLEAIALIARWTGKGQPSAADAIRAELLNLKAKNPHVMDLLIIGADGRIQHWTGPGTPPDVNDRAYFSAHTRDAVTGLYVGPPLLSKVHQDRWFFAMSQAMRDEKGTLTQVAAVIIDVALLRSRLSLRMALPESSQALLAPDGTVYARTPEHHKHVGKKVSRQDEFERLTPSEPLLTIRQTSQLDGKERILSFRRLADYPMIIAGSVTLDYLLQPWRQRALVVLALWLGLSMAIILLARRAGAISRRQTELATLDSLTGIYNRRTILDTAEKLDRSAEHAGKLSILMIDVDHFKAINDNYGHATGDEVLCHITRVLRTQIRATDFVGRYGGEEFLVLMPDTGADGALKVAEKLRTSVENAIRRPQPVTISIGIATTRESDPTLDRTLFRADAALYEAKAAGRNRVRIAE